MGGRSLALLGGPRAAAAGYIALVLLHGAMGTIETDFGKLLPSLATTRQVVAIEQQAHGHTADIDGSLSYDQMVADTAALVRQLGLDNADFFGYSMGGGIGLQLAMRYPDLVRKFVWAGAASYSLDGLYPELMAGIAGLPGSQLAVLPGTTHVALVERVDWLVSMITAFLDAPMPDAR